MTQFSVETGADEAFFVTVADEVTVYESYGDAVAEIQDKIQTDTESFLAEVAIESTGDEDVAIALEQISWQQIIRDMADGAEDIQDV